MAVRLLQTDKDGIFFITFTCKGWLPLFEITNSYDLVYKWFDYLKSNSHFITGFVIMPNHLHVLIALKNTDKSINTIISNAKRFMAYEIVKRLQCESRNDILQHLSDAVSASDNKRGKLHQVFEPSFDCKECYSEAFIEQKLTYMHNNPCTGKWSLATSPVAYLHSSASFYLTGEHSAYRIVSYKELMNVNLSK